MLNIQSSRFGDAGAQRQSKVGVDRLRINSERADRVEEQR